MPRNDHLDFSEISDFTPGYFSVGEWLMPQNGSQEMKDCRPDPGGGLRASAKPTTFSTTGIPATAKCIGLYSRGGIALQSGVSDGSDRYCAVYDPADNKVKIYRWNETPTVPATSWSLVKAHAAPVSTATPNPVLFDTFVDSGGTAHVIYTLAHTSADDGLWDIPFSYVLAGTATSRKAGFATALAVQDDRAIVAIGGGPSVLWWCASQDLTSFPAANFLTVQASRQGSVIQTITAFAPGDLLIGTRYSAWTSVQGAITDPIVRTMSDARTCGGVQQGQFTTQGLAFLAAKSGVFLTSNGESFQDISTQLAPSIWNNTGNGDVGIGNLAYGVDNIYAPHGLIYDERVQAWYRSSVLTAAADHWHSWFDQSYRQFFCATGGAGFTLYVFSADESTRWNTYTWKSAPFRRPGRRIQIREVQVVCKSYDNNATIAVTVNGTTRTRTIATAGRETVTIKFDGIAETLDVQVVPTAASSSVEAPSIEAVRIGSLDAQQTY